MTEQFRINDLLYECEFKLSNPDGQEVSYTKSAIREMTIVDNWFEPFISGSVTIANPYDFLEREYFIRGDGRDEFLIKFKPIQQNWKHEEFDHTFVLINETNSGNRFTRAENYKTFDLISKDAMPFMDYAPYNKFYKGKVGAILRDIFIELLGEDRVDPANWEEGDFEIEYYVPATFKYMDVIRYLIKHYYAKDGPIHVKGFIYLDDVSKKYKLELLSKIYKNNKKYELEAFGVGDLVSIVSFDNPNNPQVDENNGPPTGKYYGALKNLGYSTPLYTFTNNHFINSLIIGYDKTMGQQRIIKLDFDTVKKDWAKSFVEPFKIVKDAPKPFAIKNDSTDKKFKRYTFPYPVENSSKIVEAEMHNALTFYNLQLTFSNLGNTCRTSGKFIDVFSPKKLENPDKQSLKSDQKLLGRWFVTEIRHIFISDHYINEVYATKTFIGGDSRIREDVE